MKTLAAVGLVLLLSVHPTLANSAAPGERIRDTIDQLLATLKDPQLKGENKRNERREKLKNVLYQRFDFTEMAKRSLGAEWRRRSPEEQKEFIQLFTELLERAYLDKIESYNGEKVRYGKERTDNDYAEVETTIVDNQGREFSIDYRLHYVNGDWKVYDVIIEDVSLVNNYRAQFNRILAKGSYEELRKRLREKNFTAPGKKS
jgi:phospholipid transport system substrate-binding protein